MSEFYLIIPKKSEETSFSLYIINFHNKKIEISNYQPFFSLFQF